MAGLFATLFGGAPQAETFDLTSPNADRYFNADYGSMTLAGRRISSEGAMQIAAAYACINILSKIVASLPLRMYRKDANNSFEAPEHPLNEILEFQPNNWQTAWDFKAMMMMHLALRGNAYARIIGGRRGFADQLEPIHPDRVVLVERLTAEPGKPIRYTIIDDDNKQRRYMQDEIFHLRGPIAPGGLQAVSPVSYARQTLGLALAAEQHGAQMFSNGARPQGVVTVPKSMSDAAFDRFKAEWTAMYGGLGNSGKTPILEDGAKFESIALTNEDAQFLGTREFQIEEICRWFDVPPVMLHHMQKTTSWGTGVEAIMLGFVRTNLHPWLSCWCSAIRRDLILAPNRFEARFDIEDLIAGDMKAKGEFYQKLVLAGILTPNEARYAIGYNPIENGDERLIPSNSTTFDNMPDNSAPAPNQQQDQQQ
jgi:HK97 family phage portal protein